MNAECWSVKVGPKGLAAPTDMQLRKAIAACWVKVTGHEPDFIFSGWGDELTDSEQRVAYPAVERN